MRDKLDSLKEIDAEILAIDPHEVYAARLLLRETGSSTDQLQYPLLLDPSLTVSAEYGVPFQMRIHVERSNRPTTFIVDKKGVLRYEKRARTFSDRPRLSDLIEELEKLQ